jgi:hypothetical protein
MASDSFNNEFIDPEDWQKFTYYLCEENRFILSDYWNEFIKQIVNTTNKRTKILKKDRKLFRARIGSDWKVFEDGDEQLYAISPHEMGPPPKHLAREGRLTPFGIPYLYLSTRIETAIAENRPWIGAEISIGFFEILRDITIVDTSNDKTMSPLSHYIFEKKNGNADIKKRPIESYTAEEKEQYIWGDINAAFSRPISPNESPLKYLPTQYLAEVFKTKGYDGIAYKSSLTEKGYNIALFNVDNAECKWSRMFEVNKVNYEYNESGNPITLSTDDKAQYQRITFLPRSDTEEGKEGNGDSQE